MLLKLDGSMHEWDFRSKLDHLGWFWGGIFAINQQKVETKLHEWENEGLVGTLKRAMLVTTVTILFITWIYYILLIPNRFEYNVYHPYFSFIPIFWYVLIRNITPQFRRVYNEFLAKAGKITLETYISQFHILLNNNAKSILVIIPGYPLTNALIVTLLFAYINTELWNATNIISEFTFSNISKLFIYFGIGVLVIIFTYFVIT